LKEVRALLRLAVTDGEGVVPKAAV